MGLRPETLEAAARENARAVAKHGLERTPLDPSLPAGDKLAILGEEYGEVCRALTYDGAEGVDHLYEELIQVASVALGWAQSLREA